MQDQDKKEPALPDRPLIRIAYPAILYWFVR
ncbi:hypothetical protein B0I18_101373 [Taibaiella chishuiensis]|uniref:Uncharacterized protein n=1 Tax=Taibaiella chishuiensis TaxID=1434707 RepID=A0A2P8DAG4_9BACT|nr:hypothetical protein B0I18_101373 [Taibaiella chishuiensis]